MSTVSTSKKLSCSFSAGILFWQSQYGFQICALISVGTTSGFYVMGPVTAHLLLPRAAHIFRLERSDGVCHPWQFILHTYSHLVAMMTIPYSLGVVISLFMVMPISIPAKDLAFALLISLLALAWVVSFQVFLACVIPNRIARASSISTMAVTAFQGFLIPRAGIPVFLRWLTYCDPVFWAFASAAQVLLKDRQLPCAKESTLSCLEHDQNILIVHLGWRLSIRGWVW